MSAFATKHLEDPYYWVTYLAVRAASTLKYVKGREIQDSIREDLHDLLNMEIIGASTRETIRKEMRRR